MQELHTSEPDLIRIAPFGVRKISAVLRFSSADRRTKSRVKGMDELTKWSHLFTFCVRASAKVCRVILLKLAGSDFELSHTIFKC